MHSDIRPRSFSRLKTIGSAALAAAFMLVAQPVGAAITLNGVTGASNTSDLTESTPTIYGGTAGEANTGACATADGTSTCNNCYDNGLAGDARLITCNPARIYPSLQLTFTFTSDTVDGVPAVTLDDDTVIDVVGTPARVTKGQQATVTVLWSEMCESISAGTTLTTGVAASCLPDEGSSFTDSIKIGIDTGGDGKVNGSGEDAKTVTVLVHRGFVDTSGSYTSTIDQCDAGTVDDFEGVCQFDVNPGDEKVTVKELKAAANFPQTNGGIEFENVLFFFSDVSFLAINPSSPYVALPVESDDTSTFGLSSDRVTGLVNEVKYYFKAAVQDQAMNISFFTSDTQNIDCFTNGNTPPCHSATPGEVVGVLADNVNCFIATAAFGSSMAPQVETFRKFRNAYLLPTKLGRAFVRKYYEIGPRFARVIAKHEWLRAAARVALMPALGYAWLSLQIGAFGALALVLLSISMPASILVYRRRSHAGPRSVREQR